METLCQGSKDRKGPALQEIPHHPIHLLWGGFWVLVSSHQVIYLLSSAHFGGQQMQKHLGQHRLLLRCNVVFWQLCWLKQSHILQDLHLTAATQKTFLQFKSKWLIFVLQWSEISSAEIKENASTQRVCNFKEIQVKNTSIHMKLLMHACTGLSRQSISKV